GGIEVAAGLATPHGRCGKAPSPPLSLPPSPPPASPVPCAPPVLIFLLSLFRAATPHTRLYPTIPDSMDQLTDCTAFPTIAAQMGKTDTCMFRNPPYTAMQTTVQPLTVQLVPARLISVTAAQQPRAPWWYRMLHALVLVVFLLGLAAIVAPVRPAAAADLAAAARALGAYRYDRALYWYATAAVADPEDPRPQCLAGKVRALQREWQSAISSYHRCLALHPSDPASVWLDLGDALEGQSTTQDSAASAEAAWQRSAALGGQTALRRLGLYFAQLGPFA